MQLDLSKSLNIEICKNKYTSFHCTSAVAKGFMPLRKWLHVCGVFSVENDVDDSNVAIQRAELYLNGNRIAISKASDFVDATWYII